MSKYKRQNFAVTTLSFMCSGDHQATASSSGS